MKFFRINLYLKFKFFIFSFFTKNKRIDEVLKKIISKNSNKKYFILTSQLRVGFLVLLKYLKIHCPHKNEIIFSAYNLPEMINVAKNLNFKIRLCEIDYKTGVYDIKKLKKITNKKTSAIVLTNMFNDSNNSFLLKKLSKNKKIILIEDNAIYFDNFTKIKNKRVYSGSFGHYSLYSFNIMKNISALYGGGISTNNKHFNTYALNEIMEYQSFPINLLLKQSIIYLILKVLSLRILYKIFFFNIVKFAHLNNILFLLKIFYPSLKFKQKEFPKYYFTKISNISKKLVLLQLKDYQSRSYNHKIRKINNMYYFKKLKEKNIKSIKVFPIKDLNFQNFIDFPILVKNKKSLNTFLLNKGIELRTIYYRNCGKIFNISNSQLKNSQKYENEIICLPNHKKINTKYIDYIINSISHFYKKNV